MSEELDAYARTNSLFWAQYKGLEVRPGIKFSLDGMPYLVDLINVDKRISHVKKGTQLCLTTTNFVDDIHALYHRRYEQNIMYLMPAVKVVQNICNVSFDPLISGNRHVFKKHMVSKNSSEAKTINGRSMVFVGAQLSDVDGAKDSANLRSIPCDRIDRDEVDHIHPDAIEMSKQRLQRSKFRIEKNWGSPTTPGHGIDLLYEGSDQRKWQIKCQACGKYTCLGETFPDCIKLVNGVWTRSCVHCGKEIFVKDGSWQADFPDRREAGFWVSGLLSPYCDLEEAMYRFENNDKTAEFMRSILGIATTDAELQLTRQAVQDCCGQDLPLRHYSGETVMGVDINKTLDAVVGIKVGRDQYHVLSVGSFDNYDDLHAYAKKLNVKKAVFDSGPYDHGCREYQKNNGHVWLCYYNETQPGNPKWDRKERSVRVNRNEWCDKVFDTVTGRKIALPCSSPPSMQTYIHQMTCTEKVLVENKAGMEKPRWEKRGRDDFFHATLYFLLAASQSSIQKLHGEPGQRYTKTKNSFRI